MTQETDAHFQKICNVVFDSLMKHISLKTSDFVCFFVCTVQGRIQDFKLGGGGVLKIISPSGGRRENFGGSSWIQPLQCLWLLTLFGKQVRKSYHTKIVVFYNDISVKIYTCHEQYLQLGLTWCTHIDIKL